MSERFSGGVAGATAIGATPTTFQDVKRGVYLGATGNVTFTMENGQSVELVNLAAGIWHPIRFTAITAISSATGIVVAD